MALSPQKDTSEGVKLFAISRSNAAMGRVEGRGYERGFSGEGLPVRR